jgi:isochorismate synthase EntC
MPAGKPAGVRCIQLTSDNRCRLFGQPERPEICRQFQPARAICGYSREQAMSLLTRLEQETRPDAPQ